MEIGGNMQGLKKGIIQSLKDLYDIEIQNMLWTEELIASLSS